MKLKTKIKNEEEYNIILERIDELIDTEDNEELNELDELSILVEKYEDKVYPI